MFDATKLLGTLLEHRSAPSAGNRLGSAMGQGGLGGGAGPLAGGGGVGGLLGSLTVGAGRPGAAGMLGG